jgi:hypothetical protein
MSGVGLFASHFYWWSLQKQASPLTSEGSEGVQRSGGMLVSEYSIDNEHLSVS